jgi:2-polyprenyl-6-methoxyphenol hydroxylase-like FAD-dependent oxidoreductase
MTAAKTSARVVIAGAGPVGCTAALMLAQAGIPVTLIEAEDVLPTDMRASTFHPPSLDMLAKLGVTQKLIPQGLIAARYQYRDRMSDRYAEFNLGVLEDIVEHPYRLQCEQFKLTQTVVQMLKEFSHADVRMGTSITGFEQNAAGVSVSVTDKAGKTETIEARYLIGSDGTRSVVRKGANIEFEGFTYPELFLVLSTDYGMDQNFDNLADVNYVSDSEEWCTILRVPDSWRVLFPTANDATAEQLTDPQALQDRMRRLTRTTGNFNILHTSLYRIHQRVAKQYRVGNVLLAGDAAHANNPLGGMGMNGGLHDAVNLCEKLADIMLDGASEDLLDLYDRQRRIVTVEYVQAQTIQNKKNIEEANEDSRLQRIEDFRAIAADRDQSITFLRRNSMIDAVERSYAIN